MNPDDIISVTTALDPYGQDTWGASAMATNTAYTDTAIKGKMLTVSHEFDDFAMSHMSEEDIKSSMISMLVGEMVKSKMVEFTRQSDPLTFKITVRARAFVVPDDQVRILRKNGVQ